MAGESRTTRSYLGWNARERTGARVAAGMLADFACFGLLAPAGLVALGLFLDGRLGMPGFARYPSTYIAGMNLAVLGLWLWGWAVATLSREGRGSSLPLVPTRRLVDQGPFRLCRNPINLGAMIYYAGIAIVLGSYTVLCLFVLFSALLLAYLKLVEEKELAARFGEAYEAYRERTPFVLPLRQRGEKT
jgi:protein-S-isoprenylcysteine O-methyltransferase Ste14